MNGIIGRIVALTTACVAVVGMNVVAPTAATAGEFTPDVTAYCIRTKPNSNVAFDIISAGYYARPRYNSYRTTCRDKWVTTGEMKVWPAGIWTYHARTINWNLACQLTYPKAQYKRTFYAHLITPSGDYVCRAKR